MIRGDLVVLSAYGKKIYSDALLESKGIVISLSHSGPYMDIRWLSAKCGSRLITHHRREVKYLKE